MICEAEVCSECGTVCAFAEQRVWNAAQVESYVSRPVPFVRGTERTRALVLGLSAPHVRWVWRPYESRSPEHRADYDRLLVSIYHNGIKSPVIVWGQHVLVGQRRVEIARRLGIRRVPVLSIGEDVRLWWRNDITRVDRHLKPEAGETAY